MDVSLVKKIITRNDEEEMGKYRSKIYLERRKEILNRKSRDFLNHDRIGGYFFWRRKLISIKHHDRKNYTKEKILKEVIWEEGKERENTLSNFSGLDSLNSTANAGDSLNLVDVDGKGSSIPPTSPTRVGGSDEDLENEMEMQNWDEKFGVEFINANRETATNTYEKSVKEAYSFKGVHHIFQVNNKIERVKFANHNLDLIGFSCENGKIYIASVLKKPKVLYVLKSHTSVVKDFDWSSSNQYLISASTDKTIKIWMVDKAKCIKTISVKKEVLAISFFPFNNNRFIAACKGYMEVYNFSLAKAIHRVKLKNGFSCFFMSIRNDYLFVGGQKGYIYTFAFNEHLTKLKKLSSTQINKNKKPITSLCYNERLLPKGKVSTPFVLVNDKSNQTVLFRFNKENGSLKRWSEYSIDGGKISKAVICPLIYPYSCFSCISKEKIYMFDITRFKSKNINYLQGHSSYVTDLCWNYNESLLASSCYKGSLILWKRRNFEKTELEQV